MTARIDGFPTLKNAKTCRDCRALDNYGCSLGFRTRKERIPGTPVQEAASDEPYYKPKTNRDYVDLLKQLREPGQ